jgi:aminopeptidase N
MILALLALLQGPLAAAPDTGRRVHDALRYDITIVPSDTGRHIVGEVETTWLLGSDAPVVVPLDSAMRVIRVMVDGRENTRLFRTEYARGTFDVFIPHARQRGDTLRTRIRFRGVPSDGLIVRVDSATGRRTLFADNWPDRAHRWIPVQDHPSDKAAVSWRVEVPAGVQVIANGRLERIDTLAQGRYAWLYRLDEPIPPYGLVLGAAPMAVTRLGATACAVRCVEQSVWSYPEDSAVAARAFRRAPEIVEFFSRLVGPFPYATLAHVQSSTIFGGMENPTAIFYDERAWRDGRLGEGLIAHETAHQWFGDAVTEADWHHLWLSEGLATYLAHLWTQHAEGDSAFRAALGHNERWWTGPREARADSMRAVYLARPILDTTVTELMSLLSPNNYDKASWVLHQLRGIVGDSAFVQGLRTYYERHRHGTALTPDFQRAMEAASGQPLGWYFEQELARPGIPRLAVRWRPKGKAVEVEVEQVQPEAWGLRRIPRLELGADGEVVAIEVKDRVTRATLRTRRAPATLVVDPDQKWLLDATVTRR